MKFLAIKGNPYVAVGPSDTVYRFYTRVAQPVDITNEADIEWALSKTKDTDAYLKTLRLYDEVIAEVEEASKKTNIFDLFPRSVPATFETAPVAPARDAEVTDSDEESDALIEEDEEAVWFEELSPEDLALSVDKVMVKIEGFLASDLLPDKESKIAYIEKVVAGDSRKTLRSRLDELLSE